MLDRSFVFGFVVGLTGSWLALLLGLLHRDYLPGVLCGIGANFALGIALVTVFLLVPGLPEAILGLSSGDEIQRVHLDGSPVGFSPSLALIAATAAGLGVATVASLIAAFAALGGGGEPELQQIR